MTAFLVKGAGVVVTGTALAGKLVGESLWVTGADKQVRVRGIHRQNQISEFAVAGDRVALNLVGDIDKENITRGDWLLAEQPAFIATRVIVELECDALISTGNLCIFTMVQATSQDECHY